MQIALSAAKAKLTDLARRAEAGETILLTRHGRPVAQITPIGSVRHGLPPGERLQRLLAIAERGRAIREAEGFSSEQLQDELYDEHGLPA